MVRRTDRLDSLLQEEISSTLVREFAARGIDVVATITAVRISKDLVNANVYYSMMGNVTREEAHDLVMRVRGHIVAVLRKRLHIKRIPSLNFVYDTTPLEASQVEEVFKKIGAEEKPAPAPEDVQ